MKNYFLIVAVILLALFNIAYLEAGEQTFNDATNLFNERGYSQNSRTVSSGNVEVNNFSGNVIYTQRLYDIPGRNGLDLKVDLIYNGNVQHMSPNFYQELSSEIAIYYLTGPEWIISVNGIAVQLLNFETKGRNKSSSSGGLVTSNEISMLVKGYHVSEGAVSLNNLAADNPAQMNILMGDGSYLNFVNAEDLTSSIFPTTGVLFTTDKENPAKGYRSEEGGEFDVQFWLYPGDGTEINFEREIPSFRYVWNNSGTEISRPKYYKPTSIKNNIGDTIGFVYEDHEISQTPRGRKRLKTITTSWGYSIDIIYCFDGNGIPCGIELDDGIVSYVMDKNVNLASEIMMIGSIERSSGGESETTTFTYHNFSQSATKRILVGLSTTECFNAEVNCPASLEYWPYPINEINYPNGLKETFEYLTAGSGGFVPVDVSFQASQNFSPVIPKIRSNLFELYGRDPFYLNMVEIHEIEYEGNIIAYYEYEYEFDKDPISIIQNKAYHHYKNDIITTVTTKKSGPTDPGISKEYLYKTMIIERIGDDTMPEGITKLIRELVENPLLVYIERDYDWFWPSGIAVGQDVNDPITVFFDDDDFGLKLKTATVREDGKSYSTAFSYLYKDDYSFYHKSILQIITTGSLSDETTIDYEQTFLSNPADPNSNFQYYKSSVPKKMTTKPGALSLDVSKSETVYFLSNQTSSSPTGYKGQIKEKKDYYTLGPDNAAITRFDYFVLTDPNGAGNLKSLTDPNGNKTEYFYESAAAPATVLEGRFDPVDSHEDNYSFQEAQSRRRFPVKITSNVGADQLITSSDYDLYGNQIAIVDANSYISKIEYDWKNRVEKIITPGDFHSDPNDPKAFTQMYLYDDIAPGLSTKKITKFTNNLITGSSYQGSEMLYGSETLQNGGMEGTYIYGGEVPVNWIAVKEDNYVGSKSSDSPDLGYSWRAENFAGASPNGAGIRQNIVFTAGAYYEISGWFKVTSGSVYRFGLDDLHGGMTIEGRRNIEFADWDAIDATSAATWTQFSIIFKCLTGGTGDVVVLGRPGLIVNADDVSVREIVSNYGLEFLENGEMEGTYINTGEVPGNWQGVKDDNFVGSRSTDSYGNSYSWHADTFAGSSPNGAGILQKIVFQAGSYYEISGWFKVTSGSVYRFGLDNLQLQGAMTFEGRKSIEWADSDAINSTSAAGWTHFSFTFLCLTGGFGDVVVLGRPGLDVNADDISVREIDSFFAEPLLQNGGVEGTYIYNGEVPGYWQGVKDIYYDGSRSTDSHWNSYSWHAENFAGASPNGAGILQRIVFSAGSYYEISGWFKVTSGSVYRFGLDNLQLAGAMTIEGRMNIEFADSDAIDATSAATWTKFSITFLCLTDGFGDVVVLGRPGLIVNADDVSVREIVSDKQEEYIFDGLWNIIETRHYTSTTGYDSRFTTWDEFNRKTSETDFRGNSTSYEYDALDRLIKVTHPDGAEINYSYETQNNVTGYPSGWNSVNNYALKTIVIDENGHKVESITDAKGQKRKVETFTNFTPTIYFPYGSTYFDYDALGNMTIFKNPEGQESTFQFDALSRLSETYSPDMGSVKYRYDANGNNIFKQDANRATDNTYGWTYFKYDDLDRLLETGLAGVAPGSEPSSGSGFSRVLKEKYFYDLALSENSIGKLSISIDYESNFGTKYDFDWRGRIKSKESIIDIGVPIVGTGDPANESASVFDSPGSVTKIIEIEHDQVVSYSLGSFSPSSNPLSIARVSKNDTTMAILKFETGIRNGTFPVKAGDYVTLFAQIADGDDLAKAQLAYFINGDISEITGEIHSFKYDLISANLVTGMTYPDNLNIIYDYNKKGQLSNIPDQISGFGYDKDGRINYISYKNAATARRKMLYNERGWITNDKIYAPVNIEFGYNYEPNGNMKSEDRNHFFEPFWLLRLADYTYDEQDRLKTVNYGGFTDMILDYHKNGNRDTYNGLVYDYGVNNNRLLGWDGQTYFSYDANGNLISDTQKDHKYYYDWKNRLSTIKANTWKTWEDIPASGDFAVENGELSYYLADATGWKYAKKKIPEVQISGSGALITFEFKFSMVDDINANYYWLGIVDSLAGSTFYVRYFEKIDNLLVAQISAANGTTKIYQDINLQLNFGTEYTARIEIDDVAKTVSFYFDDLLMATIDLDETITSVNEVKIKTKESHFHIDDLRVESTAYAPYIYLDDFSDGFYDEFVMNYYNTDDVRVKKISDNGITNYISDGLGNVLAEIDGNGILQNKYVYGNGQKLVKLERNNVVPVGTPYDNTLETASSMADLHGEGAVITQVADNKKGSYSVKTSIPYDTNNFSNFGFLMNTDYSTGSYRYIHVWIKPLDNAEWVEFYLSDWSATLSVPGQATLSDRLKGDSDGDGKFEVGVDLVAGRWNELWLDVNNVTHINHTWDDDRDIKEFSVHTNTPASGDPNVEYLWDHAYATNEPHTVNYFYNDYLGSLRVITSKFGTVHWRRDYYPFGGDRTVLGTGNDYTYEGHEKDTEIELWNNQARFFNEEGRFTQVDPLWMKYPSLSPYIRVANNPLRYIDPDGEEIRDKITGFELSAVEATNRIFSAVKEFFAGRPAEITFLGVNENKDFFSDHGHSNVDGSTLLLGEAVGLEQGQLRVTTNQTDLSLSEYEVRINPRTGLPVIRFFNKEEVQIVLLTGEISNLNPLIKGSGIVFFFNEDTDTFYLENIEIFPNE